MAMINTMTTPMTTIPSVEPTSDRSFSSSGRGVEVACSMNVARVSNAGLNDCTASECVSAAPITARISPALTIKIRLE